MKALIQQSSGIERLTKQVKDAEKLADASMIELEDLQKQYQETLSQLVISLQP
jgi:SMC interacting uncharacterized protein involved in chromosome segregation